jgi:hypothetical protein
MVHDKAGVYAKEGDAELAEPLAHVLLHLQQRMVDLGVVPRQLSTTALW